MLPLIRPWIPYDSNSYSSIQYVEYEYRECSLSLTEFHRYPRPLRDVTLMGFEQNFPLLRRILLISPHLDVGSCR